MPLLLWSIYLIFWAVFTLGQLQRIQLSGTTALYVHDLIAAVFVVLSISRILPAFRVLLTKNNLKRNSVAMFFLLWVLLGVGVYIWQTGDFVPSLYLGRIVVYCLFVWSGYLQFAELQSFRKYYVYVPLLTGCLLAWLGLLQYLLIPDTVFLSVLGWDDHYYRMIGTILDPNYHGAVLLLTATAAHTLWRVGNRKTAASIIVAIIALLPLTFSRWSFITAAVTGLVVATWLVQKQQLSWTKFLGGFLAVLVIAVTAFQLAPKPTGEGVKILRTASIVARLHGIQEDLTGLSGHRWLLGTGLYAVGTGPAEPGTVLSHARLPDNILVLLLTQTGVVGLALSVSALKDLARWLLKKQPVSLLAIGLVLFHSMATATVLQPFVLLLLLASCAANATQDREMKIES